MSGIVGLVQFDGSPVDPGMFRKFTDFLAFRGPDDQQTWIKDNVAFGHTLFKTTEESERDSQPLTLDGKTWIVADARIDSRDELFAALKNAGEPDLTPSNWTDAELILRAYRVWGANCVDHLLGDFAFGIWDDGRQQLFCARDHMGVKPFYYAQLGSSVIFSNTLDCIRRHPSVSDRLNDLAMADFLLFEFNQDQATTSFANVQRIPPAHCVSWSRDGFSMRRYWSMPIDEPIFYKRADDYTEQFHDLLRKCVADRLRTNQVWVFMSGGLDSSSLAAAAHDLMQKRHANFDLRALTNVDSFVPDEARYAGATANHLGIPIVYRPWTKQVGSHWEHIPFSLPEPLADACLIPSERQFWSQLGGHSRVFFYGEGPDNALRLDWRPYLAYLLRNGRYRLLFRSGVSAVLSDKRPPFWGRILNTINLHNYLPSNRESGYPIWLNPKFESRLQLHDRWSTHNSAPRLLHPIRPQGYASLHTSLWQAIFESFDLGVTKSSFEVRHPFVDIRMLRFLLAVPPLPWCRSKYLLRTAMRGRLPSEVLHRRKATPNWSPLRKYMAEFCRSPFAPVSDIREYIDPQRLPNLPKPFDIEGSLRARSLNHWLQNSYRNPHNLQRALCD